MTKSEALRLLVEYDELESELEHMQSYERDSDGTFTVFPWIYREFAGYKTNKEMSEMSEREYLARVKDLKDLKTKNATFFTTLRQL